MKRLSVLAALAACGPAAYVANVYSEDGVLHVERCSYGGACTDVAVGDAPAPDLSHAPAELQRDMVAHTLDTVKTTVIQCGGTRKKLDSILVRVKVRPLGDVEHVFVDQTDDAKLAECVAVALHGARFPKTQKGGAFRYTFVL